MIDRAQPGCQLPQQKAPGTCHCTRPPPLGWRCDPASSASQERGHRTYCRMRSGQGRRSYTASPGLPFGGGWASCNSRISRRPSGLYSLLTTAGSLLGSQARVVRSDVGAAAHGSSDLLGLRIVVQAWRVGQRLCPGRYSPPPRCHGWLLWPLRAASWTASAPGWHWRFR